MLCKGKRNINVFKYFDNKYAFSLFLRHTQTPTEARNRQRNDTTMRSADLRPRPMKT